MKKTMFLRVLFFVLLTSLLAACESSTSTETPIEQEHFNFVLYDGLTDSITIDIAANLRDNYDRITSTLQVDSMPLVTIKIWRNYNNYLDAMQVKLGRRYNGANGYISGFTEASIFFNSDAAKAATHEFAHLVSMQVNSTISNNPRWLWEATALYLNEEFVDPSSISSIAGGNYPTISQLNNDFNINDNMIYRVGYVLGKFIVDTWGTEGLIHMIENNGRIQQTLGISESDFETGWKEYIQEKYF